MSHESLMRSVEIVEIRVVLPHYTKWYNTEQQYSDSSSQ
jgi:hypothetical protein